VLYWFGYRWMPVSSIGFGYMWDACKRWLVWLQVWLLITMGNLGALSYLDVIKSRCFYLQLNLLLSLSYYKLAYHYFSYTC
jgi:hypothetical protein